MRVLLAIAQDRAVCEALRAAVPSSDAVLFEPSVDAAARRLVSLRVDAILLDDGPQRLGDVFGAVKSLAPDTPVIVLSSRGDMVTRAGLVQAGADAIVLKPFPADALLEALAGVGGGESPSPAVPAADGVDSQPMQAIGQHQMALRWLSRAAASSEDPSRLGRRLVESAVDIFGAVRCAVLLEGEEGVRVVASEGMAPDTVDGLCLHYAGGIMRHFDQQASLIDMDRAMVSADAAKEMQILNARLAAPLLRNGRVFGAIVLGEKASGASYGPEERELLSLMARSVSVTFERVGARMPGVANESRFGEVFARLPMGAVSVLPDRTVGLMNPAAERVLALRAADVRGRSVQKLGSGFADVALRVLEDGEGRLGRRIADPGMGGHLMVDAVSFGEEGVLVTFAPVEEEPAATAEIAYSPFWEYLSSRVAQEIKNPMVAINTFAQLLPRKYDSEDFRDAFSEVVQKEVVRINTVVETLFEFARNPKLSIQRASVNETLSGILKNFEDELGRRSIRLEMEFDPGAGEADLDPVYFTQAIHNVVQNSIDALPDGGTISVSTQRAGTATEIRIADSGPGVAEEDRDKVFLPFFSTRERGMGLGLTTADRILKQHAGDLKLVAGDGGETYFSMRMPSMEQDHADDSGN